MKKLLAILLTLVLMMTFAGCGGGTGDEGGSGEAENQEVNVSSTKTLGYFNDYLIDGEYTMETQMEVEGISTAGFYAVKGDMLYSESEMDGVTSMMISKDGSQYVLDPATKTCIKMSMDMADMSEMFAEEAEKYETALNTGTIDIGGVTYEYEEFAVEEETTAKYCYDGDELKYIVTTMDGEEYTMQILSMEKGADSSLFEIPEGYTVLEL